MGAREILAAIIGIIQSVIGALAIVLAYVLHYNLFDIQANIREMLGISVSENLPLYMLLAFTFGFFSIASGFILIHEWMESR
jgi:hypothetical protein